MSFSPTDTTNLCLCLTPDGTLYTDSGRTTPVTSDGDAVGSASDSSADSNHFSQATGGSRPLYKTGIFPSGKPSIRTDGSTPTNLNRSHASASANLISSSNSSCTYFMVVKPIAMAGTFHTFFSKGGSSAQRLHMLMQNAGNGYVLRRYDGAYAAPLNAGLRSFILTGTTYVLCYTYDASAGHESLWIDGRLISRRTASVPAADTTSAFIFGATSDLGLSINADFGPILAYTGRKTRKQINATFAELATWAGTTLSTADDTVRFVMNGDSIAEGFNSTSTADGYGKQLLTKYGKTYGFVNYGQASQTQVQITAEVGARGAPGRLPSSRTIYIAEGGINDTIFGTAAATIEADYQAECEAARATGQKVVAKTLHENTTTTGFGHDDIRQAFNTWLRANYTGFADALADIAADSRVSGPAIDLHPDDTLHGYWADIIKAAIDGASLIPAAAYTVSGGNSGTLAITIASGETFDGEAYVNIGVSAGTPTIAVTGSAVDNGDGTWTVTPNAGQTGCTFTNSATATITYTNGQGWADAANTSYSAGPDTTPPTVLTTSNIDSTGLLFTIFTSEPCTGIDDAVGVGDFTLSGGHTISTRTGSEDGIQWVENCSLVYKAQTLALSYVNNLRVVDDPAGNILASFVPLTVVNNSAVICAVPGGLAASPRDTAASITWTANTEPVLKDYRIWTCATVNGTYTVAATVLAGSASYRLTGLTNGVAVFVKITSRDTADNESSKSSSVSVTPAVQPRHSRGRGIGLGLGLGL